MKRYHIRTNDRDFNEFAKKAEKMTGKPSEEIKKIFSVVRDVMQTVFMDINCKNISRSEKASVLMSLIQNLFLHAVESVAGADENEKISVAYSLIKNPLDSLGLDIIIKKREGSNEKDN